MEGEEKRRQNYTMSNSWHCSTPTVSVAQKRKIPSKKPCLPFVITNSSNITSCTVKTTPIHARGITILKIFIVRVMLCYFSIAMSDNYLKTDVKPTVRRKDSK